ncbi:MAG: M23 family metallopeptidase [Treponema sp.]|nr:M23 family metallopeptidase [Treponema sp.]
MGKILKIVIIVVALLTIGFLVRPPVTGGRLSSLWGIRFTGESILHAGSDIAHSIGTPINPAIMGRIRETGYDDQRGNYIRIAHAGIIESRYYHLDSININNGDTVNHSSIIGTVGNTGYSTGPHLHYEIRLFGIPLPPFLLSLPGMIFKYLPTKIEFPNIEIPANL